ncbi:Uncharacterised protein [Acinetobacter baumannii]|nr:Uncharacterised protein [Acinetobacter baumannii]SSU60967.1 Uncharacterised protein [Acinetobacter baumannii]SSU90813.1 Uncharacterised protein [Acinetobacter baumannii]HAV5374691.1 hypothetical protein [Acinetobacter baumannii]
MNQSNENSTTKPNISIEGKMSTKDAGKVAIIMAWGKAISLVTASLASLIGSIAVLIWRLNI